MNPVLSEQQVKETVKKYEAQLKEAGAKIVNKEFWGLRKLAYKIQNRKTGFYQLLEFTVDGEFIQKFELDLKRDMSIMRFLTVALDKHGIEYNEKRREKKSKQSA